MLASILCLTALATPQGSQADPPVGLTVVVADVGQGDGVVVRAPDGTVHCFDAGPNGQGSATIVPLIQSLQPSGYGYTVCSHYHSDHLGGLDTVLSTLPFQTALDRGNVATPSTNSFNDYVAAAGGRRTAVVVGATYQLGGGATMTCICANGQVAGGGYVNPAQAQEENARSVAMRIDYGDFSMWIGGDLTGGGNSTADVESVAAFACGDVDVYKLNHHGSNTSTSTTLVTVLDPELAVVSCGAGNPYGHPTTTIVNRLNQALASRALLATTRGSSNVIGFGVLGDVRIDSDGFRYRATAGNGDFLDFYCDEHAPAPIAVGDLRISELQRNPSVVSDTNGEYIEVVNVGAAPLALDGLQLSDNGGTVTIASNYLLVPGRPMLFQSDGNPSRNGGQPLGAALPWSSISLGNTSDSVTVASGGVVVDSVSYSSGFPGGSGVAAERVDLLAGHGGPGSWNYVGAAPVYGAGDRGTPGAANAADATVHPVQVGVDVHPDRFTLHATALDHGLEFSVLGLSYGSSPGFVFNGVPIPLNSDSLFQSTLGVGELIALQPVAGYRSVDVLLPQPNPIAGVPVVAAHIVLDFHLAVLGVSSPAVVLTF
ncbi:MAG: lamin tail domain-containing protein [Planctomycetes bacterium]|nr:lamin tail domain-containing protein [Planctomycetota bacterium]